MKQPNGPAGISSDQKGHLVHEVAQRIEYDVEAVRGQVRTRLREPSEEYVWIRGDRFVAEALRERWADGLDESFRRALADVHEQCLVEAATCLDLATELEQSGQSSWIGVVVLDQLSSVALDDVLCEDEFGGSVELWPEEDGDSKVLA